MRFAMALVCFVLAGPANAKAQEPPSLKLPFVVYAGSAAFDYHSTHHFLQFEGMQEWNPAVNWLDHRPKTMIAVGAGLEAAAAYGLYRWIGRTHPRVYRVVLYTVTSVHVAAAWRNYDTGAHPRIAPGDRVKWARYRRCGYAC